MTQKGGPRPKQKKAQRSQREPSRGATKKKEPPEKTPEKKKNDGLGKTHPRGKNPQI